MRLALISIRYLCYLHGTKARGDHFGKAVAQAPIDPVNNHMECTPFERTGGIAR